MTVDEIREAAIRYVAAGKAAQPNIFTDSRCQVNNYHSVYRTAPTKANFSIPVQVWVSIPVKELET